MRPAGVPQRSSSPLARSRTRSCCARPWPPPRARPCEQAARRPERVIADKGYPSKANRAWLREHGIKATIPEWDDQIAHRRREPGRPIDFGRRQQERYRGRNVVELSVSKLKRWRAQPCAQTGPPATTTTRSAWPPPSTGSTPALATRPGRQGGTAWAGHRCGKGAIMCWCRMTLLPAARLAAARNYWLCTTTGCAPRRPRVPRTRPRCGEW